MNDTLVKGIWAGFIAALFGDAAIHKLAYFIFHTSTTSQYIASLIFHTRQFNDLEYMIGFMVHIGSGAVLGAVMALIYKYCGEDYAYLKGIGLGFTMWVIHIVIIPNIINSVQPYILRTPMETVVDLIAHLAFSILTTTVFLNRYFRLRRRY